MTKRQNQWINKKWDELKRIYGKKCMICGLTENLEFAHVRETGLSGQGRGKSHRYYDIVNNPDCYRLYCMDCHINYDSFKAMVGEPEDWGKPFIGIDE